MVDPFFKITTSLNLTCIANNFYFEKWLNFIFLINDLVLIFWKWLCFLLINNSHFLKTIIFQKLNYLFRKITDVFLKITSAVHFKIGLPQFILKNDSNIFFENNFMNCFENDFDLIKKYRINITSLYIKFQLRKIRYV